MEKGFNDDELADIMNEIESLEKEFTDETKPEVKEEPEAVVQHEEVEAVAHHEEPEAVVHHEEVEAAIKHEPTDITEMNTVEKVSELPVEQSVQSSDDIADKNIHKLHQQISTPAVSTGNTAMSFNVEGNMKLDLAFNISGKSVKLNISEDGFELCLDNGMKFSIPLKETTSGKKAA